MGHGGMPPADELTFQVHQITRDFPPEERYGLTSQLIKRRSIVAFSSKSALRCKTLFVILATMIVTMPFWGCGEDEEEIIPFNGITSAETSDPNLEAAIREELGKPLELITAEDLAVLTQLRAAYGDISSLDGIQYCVNLRNLNLDANQISDIGPLIELTRLWRLTLMDNPLNDESINIHIPALRQIGVDVDS